MEGKEALLGGVSLRLDLRLDAEEVSRTASGWFGRSEVGI